MKQYKIFSKLNFDVIDENGEIYNVLMLMKAGWIRFYTDIEHTADTNPPTELFTSILKVAYEKVGITPVDVQASLCLYAELLKCTAESLGSEN